jgi:hypothetical protein
MSILDDENILIGEVQKSIHPLNMLQHFISYDEYIYSHTIDSPTFDDIYPILNQIWDVSGYTLFEWKVSRYGAFYLNYIDPEHANHPAEICRIVFFNYKKFNEIQTIVKMSSPNDLTFCGYLYEQREELYDLVKHFQNKLIEKNKLRKKGENLYII